MKRNYTLYAIRHTPFLLGLLFLSGCVVRSYPVTRERVDQDLGAGNRGFVKGQGPAGETKERKATRTTQIVEIELHPPIRFERMPKEQTGVKPTEAERPVTEEGEDTALWGNRGFITKGGAESESAVTEVSLEKYTVQKGDTLQKISQKFYGTTKKWNKIYKANSDNLKSPNRIYPGQVIVIPQGEPLKEPVENLK